MSVNRHICPICNSDEVRIKVTIAAVLSPNDEEQPFDHEGFIVSDATFDERSEAWCDHCGWRGTAGQSEFKEETTLRFRVGRVHHFSWLRTESAWAVARLYPDGLWRCLGTDSTPFELEGIVLRCVPWEQELRLTLTELEEDLWQFEFVLPAADHHRAVS